MQTFRAAAKAILARKGPGGAAALFLIVCAGLGLSACQSQQYASGPQDAVQPASGA